MVIVAALVGVGAIVGFTIGNDDSYPSQVVSIVPSTQATVAQSVAPSIWVSPKVTAIPAGPIIYRNTQYGFSLDLLASWKGYTVIVSNWEGYIDDEIKGDVVSYTGPKIIVRHPKWTTSKPYQDIPIMVFTLEQWDLYSRGLFMVSSAGVSAPEIGRNNVYVFATPPRWIGNGDAPATYEARDVLKTFKTFNFSKPTAGGDEYQYVIEFDDPYGGYDCSQPIQVQRKTMLVQHRGSDPAWETLYVPVNSTEAQSFCKPGRWVE